MTRVMGIIMTDFVAIQQALVGLQADIAASQATITAQQAVIQGLIDAVNEDKGDPLGTATLDANSRLQPAQHPALSSGQVYIGNSSNAPVAETLLSAIASRSSNSANEPLVLDGSGKTPVGTLPSSIVTGSRFKGVWNANTNTPNLSASSPEQGDYYYVSVSGSTDLDGITTWEKSDTAIFDGANWDRMDGTDAILTVEGDASTSSPQTGTVELSLLDFALETDGIVRGNATGNAQIETFFSLLESIFIGSEFDFYNVLFYIYKYYTSDLDYEVTSTFGNVPGGGKYIGGVLASDGHVYCVPHNATEILKIDPETDTTSTFGNVPGGGKYYGGVLGPNGHIYCVPHNATEILKINPETSITSTFGNLPGSSKFAGGVLAPNGKIYCVPVGATGVLVIDPETDTISTFGSIPSADTYYGGVLAPNGCIYCVPLNATGVIKIDPKTDTISTFGSIPAADTYIGGVLAPNGFIYCVPHNATEILKIDPETDTVSTFGNVPGSAKYYGGALAPDGLIYCVPNNATQILKIDPETDTVSTFGNVPGSAKYIGGVLASDGRIYCAPLDATEVLAIGGGLSTNVNFPLKPYLNKF